MTKSKAFGPLNDAQMLKCAEEFRAGILMGKSSANMCFMVCAPLEGLLRVHGVPIELCESTVKIKAGETNHCWLKLADGRVIDPTADQFDKKYPKVYFGKPIPALHSRPPK